MKMRTAVGSAGFDDHRFRGFSLYRDLLGVESFTAMIALAIDGVRRTADEAAMLDDLAAAVCVADPRIWPCKLARVSAGYGSPLAGVAASTYAMQDALIGPWTAQGAAEFLEACGTSASREELSRQISAKKRVLGFGVPARGRDERVLALSERIKARGRETLPWWKVTEALIDLMRSERGIEPNISIAFAAACLDLGFAPKQIGLLATALWQLVPIANAAEGSEQSVLQQMPFGTVEYVGAAPRATMRRGRTASR
jgi:hypothetical protein